MEIDIERLKEDLMNYFGSATEVFPIAIMDLGKVEKATPLELIEIARENKFDLNNYVISSYKKER